MSSPVGQVRAGDRKSTRLNSSHRCISYAVFCLKKKHRTQRLKTRAKQVQNAGGGAAPARRETKPVQNAGGTAAAAVVGGPGAILQLFFKIPRTNALNPLLQMFPLRT